MHPSSIVHYFTEWVESPSPEGLSPTFDLGDTVAGTYSRRVNNANKLRASNASKPLVWHWLNHHNALLPEVLTIATMRKFLRGHIEELETIALLREYLRLSGHTDTEISDTQTVTDVFGIEGHCDLVLRNSEGSVVLDVKTASTFSYDRWTRRDYNDDYGYITQLALYRKHLGVDDAALLISSKERQTYLFRVIPDTSLEDRLEHTRQKAEFLGDWIQSGKTLLDGLDELEHSGMLPPMVESMYRNKGTGRFKPHPSIAYDSVKYLLYDIYEEGEGAKRKEYAASHATNLVQRYERWINTPDRRLLG